jgi:predicted secreted protein
MAEFDAFGTLLKRGDGGGPETFATVAQVTNITGPGLSADTVDVTAHDSPSGFREFIATLVDTGEVTLELVFDPDHATHIALRTDMVAKILRNFQLIFPDTTNTQWDFAAFVTGLEPSAPVDGALTASATLKLSGVPTLT